MDAQITFSSETEEKADYMEALALRSGMCSKQSLMGILEIQGTVEEEDDSDNICIDAHLEGAVDEALELLYQRQKVVGDAYPFQVSNTYIKRKKTLRDTTVPYQFMLLLSTSDFANRAPSSPKPTKMFEHVSRYSAKEYFGGKPNVRSEAFGFPRENRTGFEAALRALCADMNDYARFRERSDGFKQQSRMKDATLDIVTWVNFPDSSESKLIAFGQCATGRSNIDSKMSDLQVRSFTDQWLSPPFSVEPVRMFFVPFEIPPRHREDTTRKAGLLFDRSRIAALVGRSLPRDLIKQLKDWIRAEIKRREREDPIYVA